MEKSESEEKRVAGPARTQHAGREKWCWWYSVATVLCVYQQKNNSNVTRRRRQQVDGGSDKGQGDA